ncbi:hypothetical protein BaRGS_00025431 [Batillaria attramentaria]|uniref:Uncharacterized protein n=1 Tax=Batillaria attramentaria TaxID=370345 RepID=A0ABD0K858_9CAEN
MTHPQRNVGPCKQFCKPRCTGTQTREHPHPEAGVNLGGMWARGRSIGTTWLSGTKLVQDARLPDDYLAFLPFFLYCAAFVNK